jgi:hypothetical protein
MDFPDEVQAIWQSAGTGEIVNQPAKTTRAIDAKKPDERAREQLRKRLIEMIRRNEEIRRDKPR